MTDHRVLELKLADYAAGKLPEADAEDFEMHLLGCSTCVAEVAKEQQLHAALQSDPAASRAMVAQQLHGAEHASHGWLGRAAQALLAPARAVGSALAATVGAVRMKPVPAFAFGAGLVAGAALIAAFGQRWTLPDAERPLAGATTLRPEQFEAYVLADEQALTLEGTACTFRARRADELLLVEIDAQPVRGFETTSAGQITVRFETGALTTLGFEQRGPQPSPIHLGGGQARIDHTGVNTYVLHLRDATLAPLQISLRSGDVRREVSLRTSITK